MPFDTAFHVFAAAWRRIETGGVGFKPKKTADVFGLGFPSFAQPVVSIVIPAYGHAAYTVACLRSIAKHLPSVPFEIVVVEDQSGDPSAKVLAGVPGLRPIR